MDKTAGSGKRNEAIEHYGDNGERQQCGDMS